MVLVDTAGRMQDNEPLMRALAKLVTVNKPDLTLFVGEALVGNESVDQLSKFNQVRPSFWFVGRIIFVGFLLVGVVICAWLLGWTFWFVDGVVWCGLPRLRFPFGMVSPMPYRCGFYPPMCNRAQSLADNSGSAAGKGIDGIVLTKFDTVDDKVGAAISMTYITGQPIVFVGTGQTYGDLKKLNVKSVVKALLQ